MRFLWLRRIKSPSNYSFARKSMSFRALPLLYDMIGGLEKNQINLIHQNTTKPAEWKHYVEWRFRPLGLSKKWSRSFHWTSWHIPPNNKIHGRSVRERITFLDTVAFKGERFIEKSILDIKTQYKPSKTFQYTHCGSCHPPGGKKRFYQRRSYKTAKNKLFENNIWRVPCKLQTTLRSARVSKEIYRKVPVRGHLSLKTIGSYNYKQQKQEAAETFVTILHYPGRGKET